MFAPATLICLALMALTATAVPRASDPECSSVRTATAAPNPKILLVDLDNPCSPYLQQFYNAQLKSMFTSWGFGSTYMRLSPGASMPSLSQFDQIWVMDFSANADSYGSYWNAIASWYNGRANGEIITDSRFAASVMINTPCFPARNRLPNTNLFRNYAVRSRQSVAFK